VLSAQNICFIGAGSMAEAIIRGLVATGKVPAGSISAVNRSNSARLEELKHRYGIQISREPEEKKRLVRNAGIVVLAMKPKDLGAALDEYRQDMHDRQLFISVIAGLSMRTLAQKLPPGAAVVRTMPNTSSTIGRGATGISFSPGVTETQREAAVAMFESVGIVRVVEEEKLDIITGISGSGPAYVYYMIEAMIQAGVSGGLSAETARELTLQTVAGAAEMVKTTGEQPAVLRKNVTSPGGTTEAALRVLDEFRFFEALQKAVLRAAERARELGEMNK
jgi:pyrroline-5-carboxylate reductase